MRRKRSRVQDNKNGSYNIRYFAKETGKCDVSVKVNDKHIHGSPFSVQVKARQFRSVLWFGQQVSAAGMLCNPWGVAVAVNERDEIAVTEVGNNRVQLISSDGTYLRSFGRKGDKQGEFDFSCGIAFDVKNENIAVVYIRNHRVQLFSEKGEYLKHFAEQGNLYHQLKYPLSLSLDSDGTLLPLILVTK